MKQAPNTTRRQEDLIFQKIMILFLISLLLEAALLGLHQMYRFTGTFLIAGYIVKTCKYISLAAFAAGIVWAIVMWKKGKARYGVRLSLTGLIGFCAFQLIYFYQPDGAKYMSIVVPIVVLLGLIYYIYQREFLVSAVLGILVLTFLIIFRWISEDYTWAPVLYCFSAALFLVLLTCVQLAFVLRKQKGKLIIHKKRLAVFPPDADYRMIFFSCALSAASIAGTLIFPPAAFLTIFVIAAYLFILAVYYTVKLM